MDTLSLILMIIGAINWGLVGIFQFDLVAAICGSSASVVARIIYTPVSYTHLLLLIIFSVGHGVLSVVAGTSAGFVNRLMDSPRYIKAEKIVRIVLGIIIPVSYTHLDVYKRQI